MLKEWATWSFVAWATWKTWFFSCFATTSKKGDEFIVDTGCTDHVMPNSVVFSSFESWSEELILEKFNGMRSRIQVEVKFRDCQSGCCEEILFFTTCCLL